MKLFYMALINDGSCNLCSAHELIHFVRFGSVWYGFSASSEEKKWSRKLIHYIIVQCQNSAYAKATLSLFLAHMNRIIANQKHQTIERSREPCTQNGNSTSKLNRKWMKVYAQKNFFLPRRRHCFIFTSSSPIHCSANSISFTARGNEWHEAPTPLL